jgi:hypothetical protein
MRHLPHEDAGGAGGVLPREKRGFVPGGELQDWLEAEAQVLRLSGGP